MLFGSQAAHSHLSVLSVLYFVFGFVLCIFKIRISFLFLVCILLNFGVRCLLISIVARSDVYVHVM